MSPETAHAIYTALAFALGWTCHIGWRAIVDYHDAKKNHEIHRLQWENAQLKRQLAEAPAPLTEEAPMPMTDADPVPMPLDEPSPAAIPAAPAPRKRRSPVKGQITPLEPSKADTKKVPPSIPQADLGRMQAQLSAYGRCRTVYAGGTKH